MNLHFYSGKLICVLSDKSGHLNEPNIFQRLREYDFLITKYFM